MPMSDICFKVTSQFSGCRFDVCLSKLMGVSRASAISLIERNQAKILGRKSQKSSILQDGDTIVVDQKESAEQKEEQNNESSVCNIPIIYNDDDVVVIDKPVGVASHAAKGWRADSSRMPRSCWNRYKNNAVRQIAQRNRKQIRRWNKRINASL